MNGLLKYLHKTPIAIALLVYLSASVPAYAGSVSPWASLNWAGYVAQGGTYTSVTGTWVIPTVAPESGDKGDAQWVGIGGMGGGHDLIQAGTQAYLENGTVHYFAWYEMLPDFSVSVPLTVQPGDSITATLVEQSPDVWSILMRNNTTGAVFQQNVTYHSSRSSAEWIEEMVMNTDGTFRAIDQFGAAYFTHSYAMENGVQESLGQMRSKVFTMQDTAGTVLVRTSDIAADGTSFSVMRTDAPFSSGVRNESVSPVPPPPQIITSVVAPAPSYQPSIPATQAVVPDLAAPPRPQVTNVTVPAPLSAASLDALRQMLVAALMNLQSQQAASASKVPTKKTVNVKHKQKVKFKKVTVRKP